VIFDVLANPVVIMVIHVDMVPAVPCLSKFDKIATRGCLYRMNILEVCLGDLYARGEER
jgi:hypothetical protein